MVQCPHSCDYHSGNPGHPTKNCTHEKYKVRDLINDGKLKFEDLNRPVEVEDSSRTKVEMMKQEEETSKEANFEKATMPKEKVPIPKTGSSSTTERSKEWSCEPNTEEEKRVLQDLVQNLEPMLDDQDKYITILIEEHDSRTLKWRRTLESNDAWDGQATNMKVGDTGMWCQSSWPTGFLLDQAWDLVSKSYVLFGEWTSCNFLN